MDAITHDRYVALVSHLNRLLPVALLTAAHEQNDDALWKLAAGSFRETTRLGNQPLGFWRDVFATNTEGIPASLRDVAAQLERLAQAIENDDLALVETLSQQAATDWQRLYGNSNSQPEREQKS
jgi:prephenate dehydrogenase